MPPAPYEGALLLHDYLLSRGVRDATRIDVISPMESPIPFRRRPRRQSCRHSPNANAPVPRAGAFAESASRTVADDIAAKINGSGTIAAYDGTGSCYTEFGGGLGGQGRRRLLVRCGARQRRSWAFQPTSSEKEEFGAARRRRWFGS